MNCNCITDIENKLVSEVYFKGKKILKARIISVSMVFGKNKLTTVTNSEIELEVEGLKGKKIKSMLHSYCPFCGTKIEHNHEPI